MLSETVPACAGCGKPMECVACSKDYVARRIRYGWLCACGGYATMALRRGTWMPPLGEGFVEDALRRHLEHGTLNRRPA